MRSWSEVDSLTRWGLPHMKHEVANARQEQEAQSDRTEEAP
jgi:hypothetical protein